MGGSSKPADPKVTPFQEPAAPTNPIPNFFGGNTGGGYKPDFGASKQAFGAPQAPAQPMQAAPAMEMPSTPWQAPQQPQSQPMQGMAGGMGQQQGGMSQSRPMMPFSIPTRNPGNSWLMNDPVNYMQQLSDRMMGGAPRYRNYTDTTPGMSTDENGAMRPDMMFGGFNGR